jgi:hypothetical protein
MASAIKNPSLEARRRLREQRERADAHLRASKQNHRSPRHQIELGLSKASGSGQLAWWVAAHVPPKRGGTYVRALRDLLHACADRRSPMLEDERYVTAIAHLARCWVQWVNPPQSWRPRTHNVDRQLASLARHLLARYPVPAFFDSVWFYRLGGESTCPSLHAEWFIHVARGNNLRTASGLPFPLTKGMAHHALLAPDDLDVVQALRWGQVRALGGGERLARAVVATRLRGACPDEPFWLTVVQFLANNPMLDPHQVGPIIDYLHDQRFEVEPAQVVGGVLQPARVPQPNLSMKGRSVASLLRQVQAWHRTLYRATDTRRLAWMPSGVREYERVEGTDATQRVFRVRELLSSAALCEEGRTMEHCVASYASSCARGRCAIFSLTEDGARRLTIEVMLQSRAIVQARGKRNRWPDPLEQRILRAWATTAGLTLTPQARV